MQSSCEKRFKICSEFGLSSTVSAHLQLFFKRSAFFPEYLTTIEKATTSWQLAHCQGYWLNGLELSSRVHSLTSCLDSECLSHKIFWSIKHKKKLNCSRILSLPYAALSMTKLQKSKTDMFCISSFFLKRLALTHFCQTGMASKLERGFNG